MTLSLSGSSPPPRKITAQDTGDASGLKNITLGVATIASLRALPVALIASGAVISVGGYYAAGDGGGGRFTWSPTSTATDDGGLTINPTGNAGAGRWLRTVEGPLNVLTFGAVFDNGSGNFDSTAAVQAWVNAMIRLGVDGYAPAGSCRVGTVSITAPIKVFGAGADATVFRKLQNTSTATAAAGGLIAAGTYYLRVYAYQGATMLSCAPVTSAVTLDGTSTNAIAVTWAAVANADSYQVYIDTNAYVLGQYFTATGTSLTLTSVAGTAGTSPDFIDPMFRVPSGSFSFTFCDLQVNGSGRSSHCIYFDDYANADFPYLKTMHADRIKLFGSLVSQVYFGNRRFLSYFDDCEVYGGKYAVWSYNGGDHRWQRCDISAGYLANVYASGCAANTYTDCHNFGGIQAGYIFDASPRCLIRGGSIDTNGRSGVVARNSSDQISLQSIKFSGNATDTSGNFYDIDPSGSLKPQVTSCIFSRAAGVTKVPRYSILLLGTDLCIWSGHQFQSLAVGSTGPFGTAICDDFTKLLEYGREFHNNFRIDASSPSAASRVVAQGGASSATFLVESSSANADLLLTPKGTGQIKATNALFRQGVGTSQVPVNNGDVTVEATSNTTLTFRLKGSDGTVRSATVTLS